MSRTIQLPAETIDDLIYSARAGELAALKEDLGSLAQTYSCAQSAIVSAAVDNEPESEGGTGSCLLHYPAANGNLEILTFLLQTLDTGAEIINHKNHSGNTPLHWAALNTHLECVKALVGAGADISIKNDAGLDPVFLAERSAWSVDEEEQGQKAGSEGDVAEGKDDANGKMSPGREVVEWLLSCEKNEGEGGKEEENENEAAEGDGNN